MKIRESGMPEREMWERFFDPVKILTMLGINSQTGDVAEFGCGYGIVRGSACCWIFGRLLKIYAMDIEPEMIRITREEAKKNGLSNVQTVLLDFITEGSGLKDGSVDYAMLFNILHLEKPMVLINEARRILKAGGKLGIIHWNYDPATPRGPSINIRPKPEDCIKWAEEAGFRNPIRYDLKPYHYGIVLEKKESAK